MGKPQNEFLNVFIEAFTERISGPISWVRGQNTGNRAQLLPITALRRGGMLRSAEQFELGDLRTNVYGWTIVVEYETGPVSLSNLLKYWPYVKGDLSVKPTLPIMFCHFSDWSSYGSYRDLWHWTMLKMQADIERVVDIRGRQFDHGANDLPLRNNQMQEALAWIEQVCNGVA